MAEIKSWRERTWRRARLYALGFKMDEYERYLETPHWQAFRKLALAAQLKRLGRNCCERCPKEEKTQEELHVHHLTYERLGAELITDVQIICRKCHEKEHKRDAESQGRNYRPGYRS